MRINHNSAMEGCYRERTLCVILGPLVASAACAKNKNAAVRMRSTDMTNRWIEAILNPVGVDGERLGLLSAMRRYGWLLVT